MEVKDEIKHPALDNHFIQFGSATWSDITNPSESVRRAVYNEDGVFSPHGSSELPINDMGLMIRECLKRDKINIDEMKRIQSEISASLERLTK